ncbi:protein kinase family protein [Cellulomonas palmilytica]|uniref:protein kinase family protein n=1 Tax=Cellulomonas palmilytica TaxID=2608402 RepID=UPI001F2DC3DC|nr:protein kinase family protein [Cellulomonas palmilytica]UJP40566.1 protein kinase family protein [Cellulomonas palmilytica]
MSEVVGPGTVLSGRYRVREQGTCDVPGVSVWYATDQILDRPVRAVVLSSGAIASALDGARRAALVSDPRLTRVLDVGTHDRLGYVVTEDVSGPTLAELVARAPLTPEQARAVVGEAAAALEVARRRGLHHLALRPRCLHLVGPGRVMITGLGIDAAVLGVADGDARTTSRRDSVDLVRLLYTALTGRWPATSSDAIAPGVPSAPGSGGLAVPPAELVGTVPNDLDTLCTVTLGPHDDGPHTPGDLVRELEPWGAIRAVPAGSGAPAGAPTAGPAAAPAAAPAAGPAPAPVTAPLAPTVVVPGGGATGTGRAYDEGAAVTDDRDTTSTPPTGVPVGSADPTEVLGSPASVAGAAAAGAAGAAGGMREATPEDDLQDTAPIRVQRQSVRDAFGDDSSPAVNRPGTPPPAAPLRTSAFGASVVAPPVGSGPSRISTRPGAPAGTPGAAIPLGTIHASVPPSGPATPPPSVPPGGYPGTGAGGPAGGAAGGGGGQPPVVPPGGGSPWGGGPSGDDDFSSVMGEVGDEPPRRRSFDPTALVLAVVGIGVVIGVVLAFKALFSSLDTGAPEPKPQATASQEATSGGEEPTKEASDEPTGEQSTPPPSGAKPVIASARSVDPSDDDGEHEEAVDRAFDGDTSTYWYTMTYQQANFSGFKDGVGFVMKLEEPGLVSSVTLKTSSNGGTFQVTTGGADDPSGGEVLGSGSFAPEVTIELDKPTETDIVTLWISELPTAADGAFRLELNEITLG